MPFAQTMAVLVNSILLVFIALDRYMAIKRIDKGSWEPTKLFCVGCCMFIWGFSAAVSSPLIRMYNFYEVHVVPDPVQEVLDGSFDQEEHVLDFFDGFMCGRDEVSL